MARKPKETQEVQSRRFIETARELESDENPETFERAIRKVATAKIQKPEPKAKKEKSKRSPISE